MASHIAFPFVSLLSQRWKKLHSSVTFKLLSYLTEMYQHIPKIGGQDSKVTPCKFARTRCYLRGIETSEERFRTAEQPCCFKSQTSLKQSFLLTPMFTKKKDHDKKKCRPLVRRENNLKYAGNTSLHITVKSSIIVTFSNVFPFLSVFIF